MRSLYSSQPTWLHPVKAWMKLVGLSACGTGLLLLNSPIHLAIAASLALLLFISLGRPACRQARALNGLFIAAVLIVGFHALFGSFASGMSSALRIVATALLALMLTVTTRFDDLLAVLETLLRPLHAFGVPTDRVALSLGLTMRFTENFFLQWRRLDDAYRVRTGRRSGLRLLAPLTICALRTAERVADALAVRLGG